MSAKIYKICRYPVKGLSPDHLFDATLKKEGSLINDRRFALALGSTLFDSHAPHWLPKLNFLALVKNEKLAALDTVFDDATDTLRVYQAGKQVAKGALTEITGCSVIEDFFYAYMQDEACGKPRLVEAKGQNIFTDQKKKYISIINLASIRDLEKVTGVIIDPIRFRANIYIDGLDPWTEFDWIKKKISFGGVSMEIIDRIDRCAAINVDPTTGVRDLNLIKVLKNFYGHVDMGVFAKVTKSGSFTIGNTLRM